MKPLLPTTTQQRLRGTVGLLAGFLCAAAGAQTPMGSAFTYQGQLVDTGVPVNDTVDFDLTLWDAATDGTQLAADAVLGATVDKGLFTIEVDFGFTDFAGDARWLEIAVKGSSDPGYTTLTPRQRLRPTPYALYAANAGGTGWQDDGGVVRLENNADDVGVGTTTPAVKLDVVGNVRATRFEDQENPSYYADFGNTGLSGKFAGRVGIRGAPYWSPSFGGPDLHVQSANSGADMAGVYVGGSRSQVGDILGYVSFTGNQTMGYGSFASIYGEIVSNGQWPKGKLVFRATDQPTIPDITDMVLMPGGKLGINVDNPGARLHVGGVVGTDGIMFPDGTLQTTAAQFAGWGLSGNAGTTAGVNFLGTTDNQAFEIHVNSSRALRIEPVTGAPTIIGGDGGCHAAAGAAGATISGGTGNFVGGNYAAVGGGFDNQATELGAVIGGGGENHATEFYATVAGGEHNYATGHASTVGGGTINTASFQYATVSGGLENTAEQEYATVGGGYSNVASGGSSVVAGGYNNTASLNCAFVGAGQGNVASGAGSVIPGGFSCEAAGTYGFAAGRNAGALHAGTFVWADSQTGSDWNSTGSDQFLIKAGGGVGINTNNPMGFTLAVDGTAANVTGVWAMYSDGRLKKDVEPLSGALDRLLALRGVTYEYKDPSFKLALPGRQMGLIAQDVERVFPEWVGEDNDGYKYVATKGMQALVIEALRELNEQKDVEIDQLRTEKDAQIADLTKRLERLEALLTAQADGQ